MENQDIHGSILSIMELMRQQGTLPCGLKNFENSYNVFERYLSDNSIARIDENICLEYVYAKTGQPIELPLLKDIGWAIINYLQNGRPATNSECLFVRHRVPFNAFGVPQCLHQRAPSIF